MERETLYEYDTNDIDLLNVKQKNSESPGGYDLLKTYTYNSSHQPLTGTDAAGQTTTYTYNTEGQLATVTTPERTGITEDRTTTYSYDEDGYLESVERPLDATTSHTYDSYGRLRTVTDPDGYVVTYDYDPLDRQTKVTYPDTTFAETVYERLDAVRTRDRLGRWTHRAYDALRRLSATTDELGRTVHQQWCECGSLDALTDANGNTMTWERDLQGRVTKEIRANNSEWVYEYENTTSRLVEATDPKAQVTTYGYALDNRVIGASYSNEEHDTPNVTFSYDPVFARIATIVDGSGTTTYTYHPIGGTPLLGAGMVASVDGPLTNDAVTYSYDELHQVVGRSVGGVPITYEYDALGRLSVQSNTLGTFSFQYDGVSRRLGTVSYPSGQSVAYDYYDDSGDYRLKELWHRKPDGTTISKFTYTYDVVGNIVTWTQQEGSNDPKAYDFARDRADRLRTAVWRTTDPTPTVLKRYSYAYDPGGNRTVQQIDDAPILSAYDIMNRLTSQTPGGAMRFAGTLDEAATVTIQGFAATVSSGNQFDRGVDVNAGTNQIIVRAEDYSGNERTNTYEVDITGASGSYTYDANGNMTSDGTRTFEWDGENRLIAVREDTTTLASFAYDGTGRRTSKTVGAVTILFVYDGDDKIEERTVGGATTAYIHGPGIDQVLASVTNGVATYYATDHLGSVTQATNAAGSITMTRQYDPWGNQLQGSGTSGFAYTGREWDSETALYYYRARYYDPEMARFVGEDPADYRNGLSRYGYVLGRPTELVDPSGLTTCDRNCPPDVKQGKSDICTYAYTIQDASIRQCIESKCKDPGTIICDQAHPDCRSGNMGQTLSETEMLMCPGNPRVPDACWKRVIAHEMWIHQCRPGGPSEPDLDVHIRKGEILKRVVTCP